MFNVWQCITGSSMIENNTKLKIKKPHTYSYISISPNNLTKAYLNKMSQPDMFGIHNKRNPKSNFKNT